jgi:hypothetical protein
MLLFISRPLAGFAYLADWRFVSALLLACGVVWTVTGSITVVAALWLLWSRGRNRSALAIGGTAIVASGAVFATGGSQILIGTLAFAAYKQGADEI